MRNRILLGFDVVLMVAVVFISFTARFEGFSWWIPRGNSAVLFAAIAIPAKISLLIWVGLYRRLWKYASFADVEILLAACFLSGVASFAVGAVLLPATGILAQRVSIGVLVIDSTLTAAVITMPRLLLRMTARRRRTRIGIGAGARIGAAHEESRRVLIAGAGDAGGMIARELLENRQLGLVPIGFIDDDQTKHGQRLHGLRVFGALSSLSDIVRKYAVGEVVIALPSARGKIVRQIMQASAAAGVPNRTVPGLFEILSGAKAVSALRPIQIQDLLRREPIKTNLEEVRSFVTDKTVLVTGAGGSIGSELCRQLAQLSPARIVAVGRGENSIFELLQELRGSYPGVEVKPAIVDVRDEVRLREVFEEAPPYSVFHAAAHKHVPLMESSISEAILNNVLGTRNVAGLSAEHAVEHLVLVSTDKAVRPTSIMGATKRIAEHTLHCVAQRRGRRYVSVRFGNVLGSRGSVVPTFLRQIAAGGPITITHPEMRRFFMTITEAVQLVLQAAALGRGGEVFVLDMGEPVRITDLAEDLTRLSGLEIGADIEIAYTGIRPGEKLYEELFFGPEDATPTRHPKILRARDGNASSEIGREIEALIAAARCRLSDVELRAMIRNLVPEYQHPSLDGHEPPVPETTSPRQPREIRTRVANGGFRRAHQFDGAMKLKSPLPT